MKTITSLALALSMTICFANGSFAQGGLRRGGGQGWGGRMYDPKTVETVSGEVVSVEEVHGSRITFQGKPAIIAAEVKKGDQSLKLRDDDGLPAWRGQGRP